MDFHTVEKWDENKVSRTESSRMGWSDVALCFTGPTVIDLQRHFIERWNYIYTEKYKIRNDKRFSLIPLDEITKKEQKEESLGKHADLVGVQCQIVRSASKWSHGLPVTEHSIAQAYIDVILAAEHFIYIENQFFITATDDRQSPIINKIGFAIVERIRRAVEDRKKFRVVVVMPAVPAFAGDLQDEGSLGTRAIMEFQYRSICRDNKLSIMEQIAKEGVDPMEYIRFYNLRNYDRINASGTMEQVEQASGVPYEAAAAAYDERFGGGHGQGTHGYGNPQPDAYHRYQQKAPGGSSEWDSVSRCSMLNGGDIRTVPWEGDPNREMDAFVSEELYVHSKLLIADDSTVICGSANLNDRSQLGDHDSEIAIVINDPTVLRSYMNGEEYQAKQFAATLRRQIFRKHLGLLPAQEMSDYNRNMDPIFTERDGYDGYGVPHIITNCYDFNSYEDSLVVDPLGDLFWNLWNTTARTNTEVFSKAFHAVPNDRVRNWSQYNEFYSKYFVPTAEEKLRAEAETKERAAKAAAAGQPKPENVKPRAMIEYGHVVKSEFSPGEQGVWELKELLSKVKGHLVEMPLDFLVEEDIAKEGLGREYSTSC
jgi:phospholipase D1/2